MSGSGRPRRAGMLEALAAVGPPGSDCRQHLLVPASQLPLSSGPAQVQLCGVSIPLRSFNVSRKHLQREVLGSRAERLRRLARGQGMGRHQTCSQVGAPLTCPVPGKLSPQRGRDPCGVREALMKKGTSRVAPSRAGGHFSARGASPVPSSPSSETGGSHAGLQGCLTPTGGRRKKGSAFGEVL